MALPNFFGKWSEILPTSGSRPTAKHCGMALPNYFGKWWEILPTSGSGPGNQHLILFTLYTNETFEIWRLELIFWPTQIWRAQQETMAYPGNGAVSSFSDLYIPCWFHRPCFPMSVICRGAMTRPDCKPAMPHQPISTISSLSPQHLMVCNATRMNFVPLWVIVIYTISSNQSSFIHNHIKASSWNLTIIDENNCGVLSNAVPWVVMYTILQSHRGVKFQKLLKNDPETWFYPAGFLTS